MSFNNKKPFTKIYKSKKHLISALKRNKAWNRMYTAEGKVAQEILELMLISGTLIMGSASVGSQIGLLAGGPKGAAIGTIVGAGVGLIGSILVVNWYVKVVINHDGTVRATFAPS